MKKIVGVLASVALCVGTLTACSSNEESGSSEGASQSSINLWMPTLANDNRDKEMWQGISKKFEEENKVKVNITIVPWTAYETKFLTGVASGNGPDIGYMYPEMLGDYINKDQLVELDEFVTDEQKENLLYLDRGRFQDKQFALPLLVGAARVLFYNKDLLDKAGVEPPKSWDDFHDVGVKLKEKGITPWIAPWGDTGRGIMNSNFFPFIWQNGGRLFSEDGTKTEFSSKAVIEAAQYLKKLADDGVLAPSSTGANVESSRKSFQSGESAFIVESEAKTSLWEDSGVNYGWVLSTKEKQLGTFFATDQLVMFKGCKDKQLCYKFMDYLTQGPQMKEFHKQAPYEPVGKDEVKDGESQFSSIYSENTDALHSLPIVPNSVGAYNALYGNMQALLTGQKTAEDALKDAAAEGDRALGK